ncbi:hypothetical protein GYH30_039859 [Glycine max]|nr:hypothetical protein GYH30_039859 [Glycine max]
MSIFDFTNPFNPLLESKIRNSTTISVTANKHLELL